ncbi:MAG TPA: SIS domain-containing protein [Clostridiales bacterium]|nr:SIS domain-containing protein [Clostridiales bacterium]
MFAEKYFDELNRVLQKIQDTQMENIKAAAELIVEASLNGHNIYAFGCNHAGLLAQELFYRSGGLAIINPILAPGLALDAFPTTLTTVVERLEGYGDSIVTEFGLQKGDVLIIHSVSGRNSVTVDMALKARELGVKVIALTNIEYSSQVSSRHKSGKRLFEVADLVLDNCGNVGDAAVEIDGLQQKVAPTSTAAGAAILNAMVAEAAGMFVEKGHIPPVFVSSNVDHGHEHNQKVMEKYKKNIKYI